MSSISTSVCSKNLVQREAEKQAAENWDDLEESEKRVYIAIAEGTVELVRSAFGRPICTARALPASFADAPVRLADATSLPSCVQAAQLAVRS